MTDNRAGIHLAPFGKFGHLTDWVFDLDNTLYPAECDLFAQIDVRMTEFVSRVLDLHPVEARKVQKDYYATYGTTLSGLMQVHQIDPADFLHHVHDIDLSPLPDLPVLREAIRALPGRKFVYTNGSRHHAERVVEKMQLEHLFHGSFGIEDADYAVEVSNMTRALAMDPEVLLFDEPTSSLDPELVGEVLRTILSLAEDGRTMLLVTHELGFAYRFATHVIYLSDGVVHETGTAEEVFRNPQRDKTRAFIARSSEFSL